MCAVHQSMVITVRLGSLMPTKQRRIAILGSGPLLFFVLLLAIKTIRNATYA